MPAAARSAAPSQPPMLALRGISKRYGPVRANDGIDLDVQAGSVLGLLGENGSGKSTLMKIVFGMVTPDSGSVTMQGHRLEAHTPAEAIRRGIAMVHQHFMLFEALSVVENVLLGLPPARRIGRARAAREIGRTSRQYGLDLDPDARVADLSLGRRQRVEIVKALMAGASLLILDEPTSNLAPPETAQLLRAIALLAAEGKSVVFISHKLAEVQQACERVVVLRDGRIVADRPTASVSRAELARLMVDREQTPPPAPVRLVAGGVGLRLDDVRLDAPSLRRPALQRDGISLTVRRGEILGVAGIDGNGQLELAETVAGLRRLRGGRIMVAGADITRSTVAARIRAGLAFIPADRATTSLVPALSIAENLVLRDSGQRAFCRFGWMRRQRIDERARALIAGYAVRAPSGAAAASSLSGGNQQKLVLAREIERKPTCLVALQPTWGLDPDATQFVMQQVLALRAAGSAILYISSELEEVLALADRVCVMSAGALAGPLPREDVTTEWVGLAMGGETVPAGMVST